MTRAAECYDRVVAATVRTVTDRRYLLRTAMSVAGGVSMWASFPPRNLWFFGIVSLALLCGALSQPGLRLRSGAWCGFAFGLAFYLPLLPWIGVYVGPLPWIALSVVLAGYTALFGLIAVALMRLPGRALWFALAWVSIEWARSSFPFGGFPWGRTGFGQIGSPLLSLAALGGVPLVSFAVAVIGAGIALLIADGYRDRSSLRSVRTLAAAGAALIIAPIAAAATWPSVNAHNTSRDTITIAAIQGNVPRLGLDFNAQREAVLNNHINETRALVDAVRAGSAPRPDFILWPEDSSDIDPTVNPDAAQAIDSVAHDAGVPIIIGTVLLNQDSDTGDIHETNSMLVWDPNSGRPADATIGPGPGRYDKQIIQPFGEYLPWRSFFRLFSSYADMAGNFHPGSGPGVLDVSSGGTRTTVGVSTCWEVAFDRSAEKSVRNGAQILAVPSNNATFGRTQMTYQQLAMSQVRAVEHGRTVVVAATSGVSAIIRPDGTVVSRTGIFEPGFLVARMPLHSDETVATRLGAIPLYLAVIATIVGLLVVMVPRTRFNELITGRRPDRGARPGRRPVVDVTDARGARDTDDNGSH